MTLNLVNVKALLDTQKNEILSSINTTLGNIQKDVLELKTNANTANELISTNSQDILNLNQQMAQLTDANIDLQKTLDDQINRNLRKTLIFKNVDETVGHQETWADTTQIIADLISRTSNENVDPNNIKASIERCHRGKGNLSNQSKPRLIFVKFNKWKDSEHTKDLFRRNSKIRVEQMYSPAVTQRRNDAMIERRQLLDSKTIVSGYLDYPATLKVKYKTEDRNCKTVQGQNSLSYIGPSVWNKLSENIKSCNNVNTFKHNVKKYFFNEIKRKHNLGLLR